MTANVRVPRRVQDFLKGSEVWANPDTQAAAAIVTAIQTAKPRKDGSVTLTMNTTAMAELHEWAGYLATAAADMAGQDPDARADLNAARAVLRATTPNPPPPLPLTGTTQPMDTKMADAPQAAENTPERPPVPQEPQQAALDPLAPRLAPNTTEDPDMITDLPTARAALRAVDRILAQWDNGTMDAATARHALRAATALAAAPDLQPTPPGKFQAQYHLDNNTTAQALIDFLDALPAAATLRHHPTGCLTATWGTEAHE